MSCCKEKCGVLIFKASCPICRFFSIIAKTFDFRGHIRLRSITQEEFYRYRAPAFEGDEGTLTTGFFAVFRRIFWELFLPSNSKYEVHGSTIEKSSWLKNSILGGEHCHSCRCQWGVCCKYCRYGEKERLNS